MQKAASRAGQGHQVVTSVRNTAVVGKRTLVEGLAATPVAVQRKASAGSAVESGPHENASAAHDAREHSTIDVLFGTPFVARVPGASSPRSGGTVTGGAELRVSEPGDASEREADRVADAMMQDEPHDQARARGGHDKEPAEGSEEHNTLLLGAMAQGGESLGPEQQPPPIEEAPAAPAIQTKPHPQGCVCCSHLQRSATESSTQAGPTVEQSIADMKGGGQSLPADVREGFESRFGHDFGGVRVHTDERAHLATKALNAQAFAIGGDIAFAPGQYQPDTAAGQHLLAHELTHVVQQGGASSRAAGGPEVSTGVQRHVQRGFFGKLWGGIKKVGSAIGNAFKSVGSAIWSGLKWLGDKLGTLIRDGFMWLINLVRDLPERLGRLIVTVAQGIWGVITFVPELVMQIAKHGFNGLGKWLGAKLLAGAAWVGTVVLRLLDLVGAPEIGELLLHLFSSVRKLTSNETTAGKLVLGDGAVRWNDVRVGSGGVLDLIWKVNSGRPFTTWHTINAPPGTSVATMVHELAHVYQYERAGTLYMAQALHAQATRGAGAYEYGDLVAHRSAGKKLSDFNREEQAQIAEDYYNRVELGINPPGPDLLAAFNFYIAQMKAGQL